MPVSNEHLNDIERVWDGISFKIVSKDEAKKLEKAGTHQIVTNIQARELKRREDFKPRKKPAKNRQMKPKEGVSFPYETKDEVAT